MGKPARRIVQDPDAVDAPHADPQADTEPDIEPQSGLIQDGRGGQFGMIVVQELHSRILALTPRQMFEIANRAAGDRYVLVAINFEPKQRQYRLIVAGPTLPWISAEDQVPVIAYHTSHELENLNDRDSR